MKKSILLALVILLTLIAYFGIRTLMRGPSNPNGGSDTVSVLTVSTADERPTVIFETARSEPHPIFLDLKGRTAPNRSVTVRSATTGRVVAAPAAEGRLVQRGAVLCRLDIEARQARVAEAEALLESRRVDYNAAQELADKGWASPNRAASAKASLDAAEAALNSAKIELSRTAIRAPFSGIFEQRMAETGDFLSPGGACGVVTEMNPIKVEAEITEDYATALQLDSPVEISVSGATAARTGHIQYVARTANEGTRTFNIRAALENPDSALPAGLTSTLRIEIGQTVATRLSPALLALHDDGRIGVRHIDDQDVVRFSEVVVVDDAGTGIWVEGLPPSARLLSAGQEYIREGALVTPVDANRAAP
ncbi:MAG: efflux RND transporter periplasmic adaptor subunit [Pseudomonadota bacterium]